MSRKPTLVIAVVPDFAVCNDFNKHTCIQVVRANGRVKFIPLNVGDGLRVLQASSAEFDQRYKPMVNYPIVKAVQLYLSYSRDIGITKEALDFLGQVVDIPNKEAIMATAKKQAVPTMKAKRAAAIAKDKPPKAEKPAEKRETAAQLFKDLIMEGKLADDKIFAKVQDKFGLDDSKRSYVQWYRNHLRKSGKNPLEPK